MSIHVGTSGWSYPNGAGTWNGIFYPPRRPKGFDELTYYAEHFSTVEVNSTFYRPPDAALVARWLARTPPAFSFSLKLYQKFTHPKMYVQRQGHPAWDVTAGDLDAFRAGVDPLMEAGRLLAVLVQFPSSFHADSDTRAYLEWLLSGLGGYPLAVELRHRSWSDAAGETHALLDHARAAWTLIDEPKFRTSIRQSPADASASPLVYLRLHGRNSQAWWEHETSDDRYNYLYSSDELAPIADTAARASAAGKKVAAYFNNHFSAKAVANAAILKHQLGEPVPGEYRRDMIDRYPELRGVVASSELPL
jgi:uncharacterized protein YecE (DUF72 family)